MAAVCLPSEAGGAGLVWRSDTGKGGARGQRSSALTLVFRVKELTALKLDLAPAAAQ